VANTGSNDTAVTIATTRRAAELGADAAMCVAPYYNKPDQRMLDAHFRAIADDGALPIVVYNVPGRTGVNIEAATTLKLAEHPRIVAVKEARPTWTRSRRSCATARPTSVMAATTPDASVLAMGGDGVICTCSNEIPAEMAAMCAPLRRHRDAAADSRALAAADEGQLVGGPTRSRSRPPCR
jgi:4-hydroxy-tetrahydrodipicolinate synthase